jgi:hypothetical protein
MFLAGYIHDVCSILIASCTVHALHTHQTLQPSYRVTLVTIPTTETAADACSSTCQGAEHAVLSLMAATLT